MSAMWRCCLVPAFTLAAMFGLAGTIHSQPNLDARSRSATVSHQIEGRIQQRSGGVDNVRVRLVKTPEMQPIAETFSRQGGQFVFQKVPTGDYIIETFETERLEATETRVSVYPRDPLSPRPTTAIVVIELPLKPPPEAVAPGVVAADVDVDVPKVARKRFREGMKALDAGNSERGIEELRKAIAIHPQYYAARLELGRELRERKRLEEAEAVIQPLSRIAPRRAEPHIERGLVLLALERREEATREFQDAARLEEQNWAAHFYLGWALLETKSERAAEHLRRALDLDERRAVRAHLALARIAHEMGQRRTALEHLRAFLALAPDSQEAEAARQLAERLNSPER